MSIEDFSALAPIAIPIVAMFIPIVAIVAHYLARASAERERHETIRVLARAGQPIPPELLAELQPPSGDWQAGGRREPASPNRILLPGLINVGIGLGLMGMFRMMQPDTWLWSIGLLPFFLGLGLVLYWAADRKRPLP
ncbi:DUF6249 domain-containing protein [Roseateles cellulosilyticus]|uniref:DUF6249 domain-containing protein n=1 Tax=Pelomonas cellulosilytica TaxID=2906762 RepID=A0ABS8XRG4_9BURK|nr:DUF6249 domain-containing protein [Pelomonas sp. P8]MCE4553441.1 DUF6249 domain-containing protein [Pelomonas sp. P8]